VRPPPALRKAALPLARSRRISSRISSRTSRQLLDEIGNAVKVAVAEGADVTWSGVRLRPRLRLRLRLRLGLGLGLGLRVRP
jgi:hypothetical protein